MALSFNPDSETEVPATAPPAAPPAPKRAKAKQDTDTGRRRYLVFAVTNDGDTLQLIGDQHAHSADQALRATAEELAAQDKPVPPALAAVTTSALHTRTIQVEQPAPRVRLT